MDMKRSVGITVFSILAIVAGLLLCGNAIRHLTEKRIEDKVCTSSECYADDVREQIQLTIRLVFGLSCIISGIFLAMLKNWAKNLLLFLTLIWSFVGPWFTRYYFLWIESKAIDFVWLFWNFFVFILPSLIAFYYFTRPKVKEQFSAKRIGGSALGGK